MFLCCAQIYAIYDYQVKYAVRLATENPYVPTFGADIPGGPPGLGVRTLTWCSAWDMLSRLWVVQAPSLVGAASRSMTPVQFHAPY
jgi:hypothetical protein